MPQGRRKAPFSGKAKKQQMQAKKQRKTVLIAGNRPKNLEDAQSSKGIQSINKMPGSSGRNRYNLQFFQETREEMLKRKEEARKTIEMIPTKKQEVSDDYFPSQVDMPKRPPWDFSMSKEEVEQREQKYFHEYIQNIQSIENISYFELNLETWRQLWRVLEMSDLLLIIVDIRYPVMMFPPYLYDFVTKELDKDMILVLNKVDLAPAPLVVAWREYFKTKYPKLHILMFTSFPTYNMRGNVEIDKEKGIKKRRRRGKLKMSAEGAQKIMETCKEIVKDAVDLSSWEQKIKEEMNLEFDDDEPDKKNVIVRENDTSYYKHEKYKNGVLTIGCLGTPNVGKSSLINAIMGKKVVSVSRTPGHTKHFQTIFLTKTVCLCDCPGLVFPSTVPKPFQILMGSYPIAQVREPYSTVKFLAERIDLPSILKLQHQENDDTWSAMDICDSYAAKKGFHTAKAARLDTYRAANSLLRMSLEGKICIYAYPPLYTTNIAKWQDHPDVQTVEWIQAKNRVEEDGASNKAISSEEESDEDEEEAEINTKSLKKATEDDESDESESEDSNNDSDENGEISTVTNKFGVLSNIS